MSEQDEKNQIIGEAVIELFSLTKEENATLYKTSYGYKSPIGIGKTIKNLTTL